MLTFHADSTEVKSTYFVLLSLEYSPSGFKRKSYTLSFNILVFTPLK